METRCVGACGEGHNEQQQIIKSVQSRNYGQSCLLARLNQSGEGQNCKGAQGHQEPEAFGEDDVIKTTFSGNNMVEMLTEIWQEIKKQHSQP